MANGGDFEEDVVEYTFESHARPDGKIVKLMKNSTGIVVSEDLTSLGRTIENKSYDQHTGVLIARTVYEYDESRKPLCTTTYDAEGDMVLTQRRGSPPLVGELYRGEKPFHVYPKKKAQQISSATAATRHR